MELQRVLAGKRKQHLAGRGVLRPVATDQSEWRKLPQT